MIKLYNEDNLLSDIRYKNATFDAIYADMIYENHDLIWIDYYWPTLKEGGVFIVQTDWHTQAEVEFYMKNCLVGANFVNHIVWKNEWGNHPKDRLHQCYDDIIIVAKGKHKFYPERIQVPKVTKTKGLNPSGRETKTATAWVDDICLTTTSLERVKKSDGHLIKWQKPIRLFDRILLPFTDEDDTILDLYMGSGSVEVWGLQNNRNVIGIELDKEVFDLAKERIENEEAHAKYDAGRKV